MPSIERSVPVRLHVFGLPRQSAVARVRERDAGERAARAAMAAGTCPRCASERTFDVKGAFGPGMKTSCLVCSFPIDIEQLG
jgi:hypothetical protein